MAHGRKPSDVAKTPPTQPQEETSRLETDMPTHPPRVQNPKGEEAEGGVAPAQGRKPSGVSGHPYQDTPNPKLNVHHRSRAVNRSQQGVEPEKGSQLHDTQRKTTGAPGKRAEQSHQKWHSKSLPQPQQEERMKTQLRRHRKNPTHIYRDHQQGTTSRPRPAHPHTVCEPPNIPASAYRPLPNLKVLDPNLVVIFADKHM